MAICFFVLSAGLVIVLLVVPWRRGGALESHRTANNLAKLREISIAMTQYAHDYGRFPPAYTTDAKGERLHSWRTLLLPYLKQQELYDRIDLSKPWNDPANVAATNRAEGTYDYSFSGFSPMMTGFVAVVGQDTVIRQGLSMSPADIKDNVGQTLLVVDASPQIVHWMSPNDLDEVALVNVARDAEGSRAGFLHAAMADATAHRIPRTIDSFILQALTTATGGETLTGNEF